MESDLLNVLASVGCTLGGPLPPGAKATLETALRSLQVWWRWGCGYGCMPRCAAGVHMGASLRAASSLSSTAM